LDRIVYREYFLSEGVVKVKMHINRKIFKGYIRYPVLFFVLKMVIQYDYDRDVRWMENTIISVLLVFVIIFVNWTDIQYGRNARIKLIHNAAAAAYRQFFIFTD